MNKLNKQMNVLVFPVACVKFVKNELHEIFMTRRCTKIRRLDIRNVSIRTDVFQSSGSALATKPETNFHLCSGQPHCIQGPAVRLKLPNDTLAVFTSSWL